MRWETHATGEPVGYIGYAEHLTITEAVPLLWEKYIEDAAPMNAEMAWDHLRVEVWLDSGRIILFPAISPFRRRLERALCQIICSDLLASYEATIDSGISDEEFDTWATGKENEVIDLVSKSAKEAKLSERLGWQQVRLVYYGADLESPVREENLISKC